MATEPTLPQWQDITEFDIQEYRISNELDPALLSVTSLNPWAGYTSSPRGVMFSQHIGQSLQIKRPEPRRCLAGTEREFGKYTFKIKTPNVPIKVIDVIRRYEPNNFGVDRIKENPMWTLIYEEQGSDHHAIGAMNLVRYSTAIDSMHQHFGFRYDYKYDPDELAYAKPVLPPNTVLADSPAIDEEENYCYGVNLNVAMMTVPGIIEDGIVLSESAVDKLTSKGFERRHVSWGKDCYPLNLYGDRNHYKPFPDIGDRIREDGLLFALRRYDPMLGPIEMRPDRLEKPDYTYDRRIYGEPNAKVVDVTVFHNEFSSQVSPTPEGMETQARKYYNQLKTHHTRIKKVYENIKNKDRITPHFHTILRQAHALTPTHEGPSPTLTYRGIPIDDYRVEVGFEYDVVPTIGYKLTTCDGNKGVVVAKWAKDKMPRDTAGNYAEIIMDPDSRVKRLNQGGMYEQYINATSRDLARRIRSALGIDPYIEENVPDPKTREVMIEKAFMGIDQNALFSQLHVLLAYYELVSPTLAQLIRQPKRHDDPVYELKRVCADGFYLHTPPDSEVDWREVCHYIDNTDWLKPVCGPVTYEGVTTKDNVLIGSMYVIKLEKTGGDWTATDTAKTQHLGVPAKVSTHDKYSSPGRNQPVRILGETEVRLIYSIAGAYTVAHLSDMSNNPNTRRLVLKALSETETPSNIVEVIDRHQHPLGNARNLALPNHVLECAGVSFYREDVSAEYEVL